MTTPVKPAPVSWGADTAGADAGRLPAATPYIWPYVTGTPGIIWTTEDIARFPASHHIRVNQGDASDDPWNADEYDIESGAWTIPEIITVIRTRRTQHWSTRLYCTYDTYFDTTTALVEAGILKSVFFRIADWSLTRHLAGEQLWGDVYAGQYASPASNPATLYPGTDKTLADLNADLNVVLIEYTDWEG